MACVQRDVRGDSNIVAVVELLEVGRVTSGLAVRHDLLDDEFDVLTERACIKMDRGAL